MSNVVLIDTSVFCEILSVPGLAGNLPKDEARKLFELGVAERWSFLLPWATVLETGNHIGQVPSGDARRKAAHRFSNAVRRSLDGTAPWTPAGPLDVDRFRELLDRFEQWTTDWRSGLGDLAIVAEWERCCRLFPKQRVWVWSLDKHLQAYDRAPA